MIKITKNTTLAKVLEAKKGEKILVKYRVPCLTCPMAKFEMDTLTLGQICKMYNIDSQKLIKELNEKT